MKRRGLVFGNDNVQTIMGLKTTLGAMKSTPIATMQKSAEVEPLDSRRNAKLLTHGEKGERNARPSTAQTPPRTDQE